MSLFIRQSNTSELQKRLNREQEHSHGAVMVEHPIQPEPAEQKPLFKEPKKKGIQVDLWGGWSKP